MNVVVDLSNWAIKEVDGDKKICGIFQIKAGATVVAKQSFNEGYGEVKIPFSPELMIEANALTEKVKAEITRNFVGEEAA